MTPDLDLSSPLVARQVALETDMLDAGRTAYRRRLAKAQERGESASEGAAAGMVRRLVEPLSVAIGQLMADAKSGRPGRRHLMERLVPPPVSIRGPIPKAPLRRKR